MNTVRTVALHRGVSRGSPASARIASFSRQHPVQFGDFQVKIANHRIGHLVALGFLDIGRPFSVIRHGIHAEADDLAVALFELRLKSRHVTEFGCADGCEVFRMREKHAPGIAQPLVEADGPVGGFSLEVRCYIVDSQHRRSLLIGNFSGCQKPAVR